MFLLSRLKPHLISVLERALQRLYLRHFYSPFVDPANPQVARICRQFATSELGRGEDLALDEDLILQTLLRIGAHYGKLPFPETRQPGFRYYYQNPMYTYGDAIVLFCMLLDLRPKRLVEVGSGYSSCAAMDTSDRFLDGSVEFTFIEPFPKAFLSMLDRDDRYRESILAVPLQDVPLETFSRLEANDILSIDSSHVVKTGSDVNDIFFRILPALRPGVVIQIHDIFYPFEYPPAWILKEKRSWNEAYLLRAFLQYNDRYRVIAFNDFAARRFGAAIGERMPLCLRNCGGSIWLRKNLPNSDKPHLGPRMNTNEHE
jgi:hypothetical protein